MSLILSTDTTTVAIEKIDDRLTGGTIGYFWEAFSGNSIIKRDDNNSNVIISIDSTPGGTLLAGALNSGFTASSFSTIFAGTGNAVDLFNNKILGGENNFFQSTYNPSNYVGINFNGSSLIAGGQENSMTGEEYLPEISSILNGSGNTINNAIQLFQYSDDYKRNTIVNGLSNTISGIVGNSWIGNGSGNTIQSENTVSPTTIGFTKGNFILNGHDNIISSTGTTNNYNTIIGGFDNSIINQNNSIVIGSNLTGITNTTSVNNMFFSNKMFVNNYAYSAYTNNVGDSFNHTNKLIGVIQNSYPSGDILVRLSNGSYRGQILFLIGIPSSIQIGGLWYTKNVLLNSPNVISKTINTYYYLDAICINNTLFASTVAPIPDVNSYAGLGIFVWDGTYWVRSDFRGNL